MKRIWVIGTVLGVLLGAQAAMALCMDPADCYCRLKPESDEALVRAEVLAVNGHTADLQVLGAVYYDPGGLLAETTSAEGIGADALNLQAGQIWLLSIGQASEGLVILAGVQESDGILPCELDSDFPGATADTVAGAVLCENCSAAVRDLGVYVECQDNRSGCAVGYDKGSGEPWAFLLILIGLAWLRARRP